MSSFLHRDITRLHSYYYTTTRVLPKQNLVKGMVIFLNCLILYIEGKFDQNYDIIMHVCLDFFR